MDLEHVSNRGNMQKTDRIFALDFKTAYIFTCMTRAIFKTGADTEGALK